ncbi:hypothetical protein IWW34DRAFT_817532 [Fusarium oxysporum f. sp. albedinis]|nr:hypothetical protein IWW34DRAFT_817532 [Fusarium oxysporum f. sp. albedinis]
MPTVRVSLIQSSASTPRSLAVTVSTLTHSLEVSQQPLSIDDSRLLILARNCRDAEAEWRKKTPARFLSQQQPRKRDRIGEVFRGTVNKPELDRLESQLQKAKASLETDLLIGVFKRLDISKVQTDNLLDELQTLLQASSTSEKRLYDLIQTQVALVNTQISDRIDLAEASIKTHVTAELASHESRLISHANQGKDTLLAEAEMRENSRRDNEAYERLQRSFYYPDESSKKRDTFISCINASQSDSDAQELVCSSFVPRLKSTDDRYWISGRPGTGKINSLQQWQPNAQILTYFKGFLCSLVYQLLSLDKEHAIGCLQQDPNWCRKTVPGDWDSEDLQYLFSSYLSQAARPFCLFIDGVDELMGDSGMGILINLFNSLQISSRLVKVCMPSLPWATPSAYVEDLVGQMGDKAEGIQEKILRTPKDLYNLYLNMWTRLGEDSDLYQGSTALTFKVDQRCNELYTRLPIRRADLFEVIYITPPERPGLSRVANKARFPILKYDNLKVQAIHLTVLDFLIETEGGNKIMEHHKASREEFIYLYTQIQESTAGYNPNWTFYYTLLP